MPSPWPRWRPPPRPPPPPRDSASSRWRSSSYGRRSPRPRQRGDDLERVRALPRSKRSPSGRRHRRVAGIVAREVEALTGSTGRVAVDDRVVHPPPSGACALVGHSGPEQGRLSGQSGLCRRIRRVVGMSRDMKCTPIAAGANGRVALRRRGTVRRSPPRKGRPCRGLEDWRFGASWCAAVLLVCPELRYQSVQSVESAAVPTTAGSGLKPNRPCVRGARERRLGTHFHPRFASDLTHSIAPTRTGSQERSGTGCPRRRRDNAGPQRPGSPGSQRVWSPATTRAWPVADRTSWKASKTVRSDLSLTPPRPGS